MKYCVNCGEPISDNANFCRSCGAPVADNANFRGAERDFSGTDNTAYSDMDRFLKYERIAWKAGGIISVCICAAMALYAFVIMIIGVIVAAAGNDVSVVNGAGGNSSGYILAAAGIATVYYISVVIITVMPLVIVGFKMVGRVDYYRYMMTTDIAQVRKRCTSVGMIIFAAIFNKVAMAFIIVNFVKTKTNAAAFDRLEAKKQI